MSHRSEHLGNEPEPPVGKLTLVRARVTGLSGPRDDFDSALMLGEAAWQVWVKLGAPHFLGAVGKHGTFHKEGACCSFRKQRRGPCMLTKTSNCFLVPGGWGEGDYSKGSPRLEKQSC